MTKRQRAQVVELLRCGCDLWHAIGNGVGTASFLLGSTQSTYKHAVQAWDETCAEYDYPTMLRGYTYADMCLEAALRVECGEWP